MIEAIIHITLRHCTTLSLAVLRRTMHLLILRKTLKCFVYLNPFSLFIIGINPCVWWYMTNTFSRGMYQLHLDAEQRDVIYMPRLALVRVLGISTAAIGISTRDFFSH